MTLGAGVRTRIRQAVDIAALVGASLGVLLQLNGFDTAQFPRKEIAIVVMAAIGLCGLLGRLGRAPWSPYAYIALLLAANVVYMSSLGPWIGLGAVYVVATALAFVFLAPRWRTVIGLALVATPFTIGLLLATDVIAEGPTLELDDPLLRRRAAVAAISALCGIAIIVTYVLDQLVRERRAIEAATANDAAQRAERARVEAELARARRADMIAQVAAEVGSDIGEALAIIEARAQALARELKSDIAIEALADIAEATTTASDTMRTLTTLGPDAPPTTDGRGNAAEAAHALSKLMRRTLPERITLTITTDEDVWVPIATSDLARICSNLVLNAYDAITGDGTIAVRVTKDAQHARIDVEDTGSGMSAEIVAQLFQPFFTTKPVGRGTGLGLATSRVLVERARGTIDVASVVGKGTRLTIQLPLVDAPS